MFAAVSLAARIERAEARLTTAVVQAVMRDQPTSRALLEPLGQGVAAYAGPSSPMNKLIGVGFEELPTAERLGEVEAQFSARSEFLQAEVATLADPAFAALLTGRGYVLRNFENVSGRSIALNDPHPPEDPRVRIEQLTTQGASAWIDAGITGFQHPDDQGVPAEPLPSRETLEAALGPWARTPGFVRYCAWVDDQLAAVAALRIDGDVAQLCGAATLPAFRRRGIQAALLVRRLKDGARAGCDLAVVTTQPGSRSQQNVARQGFALLYARAILIKDPKENT
jgi:ribosomal protein S18 acetylase RimI-like enzyme